eukprot:GHVS01102885.1.p1 GENE.GHVS01102885.1~~GHVS01102885.1.p1  ORF type:complete len:297 (+),score=27.84 GHVS01102885.1:302-1192(+)
MIRRVSQFILSSAFLPLLLLQPIQPKNRFDVMAASPVVDTDMSHQVSYSPGGDNETFVWKSNADSFEVSAEESGGTGFIWMLVEPVPSCISVKPEEEKNVMSPDGLIGGVSSIRIFKFSKSLTCSSCSSQTKTIVLELRRPWMPLSGSAARSITITHRDQLPIDVQRIELSSNTDVDPLSFVWRQAAMTLILIARESWTVTNPLPPCMTSEPMVEEAAPIESFAFLSLAEPKCRVFRFTRATPGECLNECPLNAEAPTDECQHGKITLELRDLWASPSAPPKRTAFISLRPEELHD